MPPLTDVALGGVALTPHYRRVSLHQTHDSVEVPLVDDSAVIRRAFGISAVKFLLEVKEAAMLQQVLLKGAAGPGGGLTDQQSLPDAFNHAALDAGLTQDVVWSDARLAAVHKLSPSDAAADETDMTTILSERFRINQQNLQNVRAVTETSFPH